MEGRASDRRDYPLKQVNPARFANGAADCQYFGFSRLAAHGLSIIELNRVGFEPYEKTRHSNCRNATG